MVLLGDCTNSSYILYHFNLFEGFTVLQAVDQQHFISEARDRFPASPCGSLVVDKILLGGIFLRVSLLSILSIMQPVIHTPFITYDA